MPLGLSDEFVEQVDLKLDAANPIVGVALGADA